MLCFLIFLSILYFAAIEITFKNVTFKFKSMHNNGTIVGILSHLNNIGTIY